MGECLEYFIANTHSDRSFQQAVQLLETYTQCKASFQDLRWAYTGVRRSRAAEQQPGLTSNLYATEAANLGKSENSTDAAASSCRAGNWQAFRQTARLDCVCTT